MRCYHEYDEEAGKVLIPGCWSSAWDGHNRNCTCYPKNLEKNLENELVKELRASIAILQRENYKLVREVERLSKKLKQ